MTRRRIIRSRSGHRLAVQALQKRGTKELSCQCGTVVRVDANTQAVTCGTCVQKIVTPPVKPVYLERKERIANGTAPAPRAKDTTTHTLVDPSGKPVTLTVRDFFKLHALWSGHVKKLLAGQKPQYKGWKLPKKGRK